MGRIGGVLPPFRTRRYVQDVRYFAKEHMEVRREALHGDSVATSMSLTVLKGGSTPPLLDHPNLVSMVFSVGSKSGCRIEAGVGGHSGTSVFNPNA